MAADNIKLKACPKITDITITEKGNAILYWTEVPGAEKYAVKRSDKPNGEYTLVKWVKVPRCKDKAVSKDTTYWYKVTAVKSLEGKKTSKKNSPIFALTVSDIPAPEALRTAADKSKARIHLKWKAPEGVSSFVVNRRNSFFQQIIPVGTVEGNRFTDKDIVAGQPYYYSVQSIIDDKQGNFSTEEVALYLDCGKIISAKALLFKNVEIQARIVAGADGYILERSTDNKEFTEVARTESGVDIHIRDKVDKSFKTYYYRVRAFKTVENILFISESSETVKIKSK